MFALTLWPVLSFAGEFCTSIRSAKLMETNRTYNVEAEIDYRLSPTAKEALHKGVPLAFEVLIKISRTGSILNATLYEKKLPYTLQFHALLNQYEVKSPSDQPEMFLTLNAALNFMASLHDATTLDKTALKSGETYQLSLKALFNREFLPVPLRPEAYFNPQWFLSSDWFVWSIQK